VVRQVDGRRIEPGVAQHASPLLGQRLHGRARRKPEPPRVDGLVHDEPGELGDRARLTVEQRRAAHHEAVLGVDDELVLVTPVAGGGQQGRDAHRPGPHGTTLGGRRQAGAPDRFDLGRLAEPERAEQGSGEQPVGERRRVSERRHFTGRAPLGDQAGEPLPSLLAVAHVERGVVALHPPAVGGRVPHLRRGVGALR
jgi:hypothetical protein